MKNFFSMPSLVPCLFFSTSIASATDTQNSTFNTLAVTTPRPSQDVSVHAAVAVAELLDKMTILEIKLERFTDETKFKNVRAEYAVLQAMYTAHIPQSARLDGLKKELMEKNKKLWELEDAIRAKESSKNFDGEFINLARAIYLNNDERGLIKRDINTLVGSHIIEEKSYGEYRTDIEAKKRSWNEQTTASAQKQNTVTIMIEMPVGELLDKITILEIKQANITNIDKLKNITTELAILYTTLHEHVAQTAQLIDLIDQLRMHNKKMWEIEDQIREKEHLQEFDASFIQLARDVYYTNDKRCAVKRTINMLLGSRLIEEKKYTEYGQEKIATA